MSVKLFVQHPNKCFYAVFSMLGLIGHLECFCLTAAKGRASEDHNDHKHHKLLSKGMTIKQENLTAVWFCSWAILPTGRVT